MAELSMQDVYLMEKVVDPASAEYVYLMSLLMSDPTDDRKPAQKLRSRSEFKHTFPFRGDPQDEVEVRDCVPLRFAERGEFRNGIASLALSTAELLDLVQQSSGRKRRVPALVATAEKQGLEITVSSAGGIPAMINFTDADRLLYDALQVMPDTLIFDHTTICAPVDEVLNMAYGAGVHIVDGVFPYHVAAVKGWDCEFGVGKWSITHSKGKLIIGPGDDPSRLMKYKHGDYMKFIDPKRWSGNAKKYGYELRQMRNGLVTYRAVYMGDNDVEVPATELIFDLPLCSSDDMVLVTINRDLAAGVFASKSNNAHELARLEKNYAIEVRRDLFVSCVNFLISKDRGSDIVGDSIRYITEHNYVDLVDGVHVVRCPSLSYADALCVAMVCSLTAFSLRYRLTTESLPVINRHKQAATMAGNTAPLGALGRLAWLMYSYIADALSHLEVRAVEAAANLLYGSDKIPGVCFDVYTTVRYDPTLDWFEPQNLVLEGQKSGVKLPSTDKDFDADAMTTFIGESTKTSTSTAVRELTPSISVIRPVAEERYKHKYDSDPIATLQHVYDEALPGNSVAQLQNVAELRRVKDVEINTEFYGKIEVNKDIAANEQLHQPMAIRTASLPVGRTSLLDAVLASAKRNFNPPDMQMQSDPWAYANYLADRFVEHVFVPNFKETLEKSYTKDPITFNLIDYLEWRATRDKSYRSALEGECPEELVELNLEKYDTIIKKRVKPKLSTSAQHELAQPQVVVSLSKKDTALFTSVFRKMFERFEAALRPEFQSAGRMSDADISRWLTDNKNLLMALECMEIDSSKYDKSQGLLARMIEALLLRRLGLDPGVLDIFADSYVGKVSSKTLGLMFMSAFQMKSGAPQTMLGNIIYNMVSVVECAGIGKIKAMIAKGDDNLVWTLPIADKTGVVERMSALFNLECKLITGKVWYFSSGYVVPANGKLLFVPDPVKMIELLGERVNNPRTLAERFVSFQDRVASLTSDAAVPETLMTLVRHRMQAPEVDIVAAVDALATIAGDFSIYKNIVG